MRFIRKIKWQYLVILFLGIIFGSYLTLSWIRSPAQAKVVTLQSRGLTYDIVSSADDVLGLLAEQNLDTEGAFINPTPETPLVNGMHIQYLGSVELSVIDQDSRVSVFTSAVTVEEALRQNDFFVSLLDEVFPEKSAEIYSGMEIVIERVEEGEIVEEEKISFDQIVRGDPEELYGIEKLVQRGVLGARDVTYRVRYRNGVEEFRQRISSEVTLNPVSEIISAGRKIEIESYENGRASWYAYRSCLCAAHPFFAKGSFLRVTAEASGKSVIVVVNDRGPNQSVHPDRLIDLDAEAFRLLAPLGAGTISVKVEKFKTLE